jgi:ATP-dependent Clp protease adaptor protein ClpS
MSVVFSKNQHKVQGKMPVKVNQSTARFSEWLKLAGSGGPDGDGANGDDGRGGSGEAGVATRTRSKVKRPSLYRVLLLNDDYTPMEFVIAVLQEVFSKSQDEAVQIMMHVHKSGVGECGVFPYEVAETKVMRVMDAAQKNQHPLQCVMEKQ